MASLNSTDLGDIQTERQSKNGNLFQMPLPTQDSNTAILYDFFGMMRTISISGIITGTDATQVTFIDAMEAIANGAQTGVTFISSKTGFANKTVYIDNFEWTVQKADVRKLHYTLSLIEGAAS
jgi:hypothetical protein